MFLCFVNYNNSFKIQKELRQGYMLSPRMFNVYGEYIMRRSSDTDEEGIMLNGKMMKNAVETILITEVD